MSHIQIEVEGMHCGGCVSSVNNALTRLDGVSAASSDFDKGIADITYDPDQIDVKVLKQAIEDAGFVVSN